MRTFIDAFERVTLTLAWIAAWLFVASGVMLSYEVVARYFFLAPTKWAAELSQLCLIYGTLLSLCWLVQHRRHIQINAVTGLLSDGRQRLVGVITMLILVWFSLYVTYFGWTIFQDSFERGRTTGSLLDLPAWIAELPVPLLFAFVAVQALIEIFKLISGDPIPSGGHE
jgi:C4-dicarboxylate transporter DctQ subunit